MDFLIYDKIGILIIFIDNYYSLLGKYNYQWDNQPI